MSYRLPGDVNAADLQTTLNLNGNLEIKLFGPDFMRLGVDFYMCKQVFINNKNG